MHGSKEQQGDIRKTFKVKNTKKQKKTTESKTLEISSRKLEILKEEFMKKWSQLKYRNSKDLTEAIKKQWQG